jgi:hypothetical protein
VYKLVMFCQQSFRLRSHFIQYFGRDLYYQSIIAQLRNVFVSDGSGWKTPLGHPPRDTSGTPLGHPPPGK